MPDDDARHATRRAAYQAAQRLLSIGDSAGAAGSPALSLAMHGMRSAAHPPPTRVVEGFDESGRTRVQGGMIAARTRYDALLLDLDGTLVDSLQDLADALNALLAELRLPGVDRAQARAMVGDGARKLVERALRSQGSDPAAAEALVPRFLAHYEPAVARHTRPFPGVVDTLRALSEAGFALAVVTNKPERATRIVLDSVGLAPLVAVVVGGDSVASRKPDPAPLHAALKALGVAPGRAVMVGDNHHDVEAARAAGTAAIAVSYGYAHRPPHELGADAVIDAFSDLPAALAALAAAR